MNTRPSKQSAPVHSVSDRVSKLGHANRCLQCHKCSAGCPVATEMDLQPSQIVRLIQLNDLDRLKSAKAIWLCTSCHTCSDRCPAGVSLSHMQDALRRECIISDTQAADPHSAIASKALLESVADSGRMNELSMMRRFKTRTLTIFNRFSLGIALLIRGKLKFLRNKNKSRKWVRTAILRSIRPPNRLSE